jgi:Rrf2 family protein
MSASTKLSTAIQILCLLARADDTRLSSDDLSRETGIHAARLRNILSKLAQADIVRGRRGSAGGFTLARSPDDIHLQEVYCAVESKKAFHLDVSRGDSGRTQFSSAINAWFLALFADIQVRIEEDMRQITLAHVLANIQQ